MSLPCETSKVTSLCAVMLVFEDGTYRLLFSGRAGRPFSPGRWAPG